MLKDQSQTLRVEEIEIDAASPWLGKSLRETEIHSKHNLLIIAVKNAGAAAPKLWVNPPDTVVVRTGLAIIVLGDMKNIREARQEVRSVHNTISE